MNKGTSKVVGDIFFYLLIIVIFIYLMFPFYWATISALKPEAELIRTPATFWPQSPTLQNFSAVLSNERFVRGLWNSIIVATTATVISLLIGAFAGFALGKLRFRGKSPSLYAILAMTMFPQVAVLAGLYAVIRVLNMPTTLSLILSYLIFTLPFTVWVLTAFFKGLPDSLLQAAQVDGANFQQTFWRILLPLTAPALVTTGATRFYQRLERVPVRADLYLDRPRSANGPGRHRQPLGAGRPSGARWGDHGRRDYRDHPAGRACTRVPKQDCRRADGGGSQGLSSKSPLNKVHGVGRSLGTKGGFAPVTNSAVNRQNKLECSSSMTNAITKGQKQIQQAFSLRSEPNPPY